MSQLEHHNVTLPAQIKRYSEFHLKAGGKSMIKTGYSTDWKTMIGLLLLSFTSAFIGAAWVAYLAINMGAARSLWVILSAAGAGIVCSLVFTLMQPCALIKSSH